MKRVLLVFLLLSFTTSAHAQLGSAIGSLFGSSSQPKTTVRVINMPQQTCNPPQNIIGKSIYQLNGVRFNQPVRIIHPGEMITSDYDQRRLDIMVDNQGIIRNVHCG